MYTDVPYRKIAQSSMKKLAVMSILRCSQQIWAWDYHWDHCFILKNEIHNQKAHDAELPTIVRGKVYAKTRLCQKSWLWMAEWDHFEIDQVWLRLDLKKSKDHILLDPINITYFLPQLKGRRGERVYWALSMCGRLRLKKFRWIRIHINTYECKRLIQVFPIH